MELPTQAKPHTHTHTQLVGPLALVAATCLQELRFLRNVLPLKMPVPAFAFLGPHTGEAYCLLVESATSVQVQAPMYQIHGPSSARLESTVRLEYMVQE